MSARTVAIADAVVALLNAKFAENFTAVRKWVPGIRLEDMKPGENHVTVVPGQMTPTRLTRRLKADDVVISIGVQRKLSAAADTDSDATAALAEAIYDYLFDLDLTDPAAKFIEIAVDPAAAPEHLEQFRVHTAVVQVTYRT